MSLGLYLSKTEIYLHTLKPRKLGLWFQLEKFCHWIKPERVPPSTETAKSGCAPRVLTE